MQIDTSALATLKAVNQFATSAVKDSDIARIDSSRPQGASLNNDEQPMQFGSLLGGFIRV